MGITFRNGHYHRFVRFGGRTIKDGEAAAVWDTKGAQTEIIGPKRIFLWYSTIKFLDRFKAESHQYLEVKYRDGSIENLRGPVAMYLNPTLHDAIAVKEAKTLKANEVLLVYHNNAESTPSGSPEKKLDTDPVVLMTTGSVRTVVGPTVFFPHANDIVGVFRWSILPNDLTRFAFVDAQIERASTIHLHAPTLWRVRVPIGTTVSLKGCVTLGITYQIDSIDKATAHADPRASLISALLSEALTLSESFTKEDFKSDQSGARNKLNQASFEALAKAAESCGFVINQINVLDVTPSEPIRRDMEMENKSKMEVRNKIACKQQKMHLRQIEFEDSKAQLQNEEEMAKQKADMEAKIDQHSYEQRVAALQRSTEIAKTELDAKLEAQARSDAQVLNFLKGLQDIGVDVGDVIRAHNNNGTKKSIPQIGNVLGRVSIFVDNPDEDKEEKK